MSPKQILLAGPVKHSPDQAPHQVSFSCFPSPDQEPSFIFVVPQPGPGTPSGFIFVGPLAGPEARASFIIVGPPSTFHYRGPPSRIRSPSNFHYRGHPQRVSLSWAPPSTFQYRGPRGRGPGPRVGNARGPGPGFGLQARGPRLPPGPLIMFSWPGARGPRPEARARGRGANPGRPGHSPCDLHMQFGPNLGKLGSRSGDPGADPWPLARARAPVPNPRAPGPQSGPRVEECNWTHQKMNFMGLGPLKYNFMGLPPLKMQLYGVGTLENATLWGWAP